MFKIETLVRVAFTCLIALTASANAEDVKYVEKEKSSDKGEAIYNYKCKPPKTDADKKWCADYEKSVITSGGNCSDYDKEYKKAKQEFTDACEEAGVTMGSDSDDVACGYALGRCRCLGSSVSKATSERFDCPMQESNKSSTRRSEGGIDMDAARRMFTYCPARAGSDAKKNEDKLEKAEDKVEKLEEKLPTLMDEANKALTDGQEKIDTIEKEKDEAAARFEEELAAAKKGMSEEQKKIMDQMSQISSQIATLDEQIGQMDLGKVDADMKRSETITQIELNCHATAAATVSKKQEEALTLLRAGRLNQGGQKDMMRRVGISDRESWERLANKYYQWCLQSKPTKDSKTSANKVFESAVRQAEKSKADLRERKKLLQEQLAKMKDPNGTCGQVQQNADGSSNETEMCRSAREAYEAQIRLVNKNQKEQAGYVKRMANAEMAARQNYESKLRQAAMAQQQLAKERGRKDKLEQWNDLAAQKGVSSADDAKAYNKAQSKLSAYKGQASNMITCMASEEKPCVGECDIARRFLKMMDGTDLQPMDAKTGNLNASDLDPTTGYRNDDPAMIPGSRDSSVKAHQ